MHVEQRPIVKAIQRMSRMNWLVAGALAAGIAMSSGTAQAESRVVTSGTANARLNFSIVIPKFLFLQVGTGTAFGTNALEDTIVFDMSSAIASVGNGTPQAATSGGDVSPGVVRARVVGNGFGTSANFTATTTGAMSNGAGNTISWSELTVAAANLTGVTPTPAAQLPHPGSAAVPFADGAATTVSLAAINGVINQGAQWTFSYKNTNIPASGTYGLTVANRGQVTYAIALP